LKKTLAIFLVSAIILGMTGSMAKAETDNYGHDWVEVTETVHHDAVAHTETQTVKIVDQEEITAERTHMYCDGTNCPFDTFSEEELDKHFDEKEAVNLEYILTCGKKLEEISDDEVPYPNIAVISKVETVVVQEEISHEEEKTVVVIDKPAYDEEVVVGYKCSTCGLEVESLDEVDSVCTGEKVSPTSISAPDKLTVAAGETSEVEITFEPGGAYDTVTLSSENKKYVRTNGKNFIGVTPKKGEGTNPGSVTVTATTSEGLTATTEVTVLFNDVMDSSAYFYKPVYWAYNNGITTGKSGGERFAPSDTCTRAQIVTFLWRLAGEPEVDIDNPFNDISKDAYYYKAVLWAYENGITTGRRGGETFDPNGTCTRREIVTFLWRYAGKPNPKSMDSKFTDITDESAYYYKAVLWAVEKGITTGKAATNYTTFDPLGECTRGMSVTFIYRYAN